MEQPNLIGIPNSESHGFLSCEIEVMRLLIRFFFKYIIISNPKTNKVTEKVEITPVYILINFKIDLIKKHKN